MENFNGIQFNGTFRSYQQSVLDSIKDHLTDKKIHIVAAPGSGKTVLGLELVRRLGNPVLILSPTVTIRQQWGERFADMFVPESADITGLISFRLTDMKLLTAVTYQSLHAAWSRSAPLTGCDDTDDETTVGEDFSGFDLVAVVKAAGIRTICLDEAHHLRSEWQKSLEAFVTAIQQDVTVISLTATPPYDSPLNEWNRYISLCGEIDEEISVPELVKQQTLCPHQDYIYFNFPVADEMAAIQEYRSRADRCIDAVIGSGLLAHILDQSALLTRFPQMEEFLLDNAKGTIALLSMAESAGITLPKKLVRLVSPDGRLPLLNRAFAQAAFQFVLDHPEVFSQEAANALKKRVSEQGLLHKQQVCLDSNERLDKRLVSSAGKLSSIADIAQAEDAALYDRLRMLVLTDHIKKDLLRIVGTQETVAAIGTVTVFETLRRTLGHRVPIGVLSGGLVILPADTLDKVQTLADESGVPLSARPLGNTGYCEVMFSGSNKHRVSIVTEVFRQGLVRILIGTAALLGEGWDSPCVNSLILASFVGSFVLSNQMRGRAIRIDPCDSQKTANIWHLVTIEPPPQSLGAKVQYMISGAPSGRDSLISADFDLLKRRFECFLAPALSRDVIESGIRRLDVIRPPYDRDGIARINGQMLTLAKDRRALADKWARSLSGKLHPEVLLVSEAPPSVQPKSFLFRNLLWESILTLALVILVRTVAGTTFGLAPALGIAACILLLYAATVGLRRILKFISPARTIGTLAECILKTLKDIEAVQSAQAETEITADPAGLNILCSVTNASLREKEVFAAAMKELLSSIDNPRYVLVKRGSFFKQKIQYSHSYACPSMIGAKKEYAERLLYHLRRATGAFGLIYTRNEAGRAELLKCRRWSYINQNDIHIRGKKMVRTRWE